MADKDVYKRERRESRVNSGRHCILAEKINWIILLEGSLTSFTRPSYKAGVKVKASEQKQWLKQEKKEFTLFEPMLNWAIWENAVMVALRTHSSLYIS
jgi:hypothetical protein